VHTKFYTADPAVSQQFHRSFAGILLAVSVKKRGAVSTTPTFQTNEYTNL